MRTEGLEVLVEEPSMEAALRLLLPKIVNDTTFEIRPYQGKSDLLAKLPARLRAYKNWLPETWRIVVVVDRDGDDCRELKARLDKFASDAKLVTRAKSRGKSPAIINRVAIEELEAWFFGDWSAVQKAYPRVRAGIVLQQAHRDPDGIRGGTWEALERVLQKFGYFSTGLRKVEAARAIAEHMDPAVNTSASFQAFRNALVDAVGT